jgi:hypothetical protein
MLCDDAFHSPLSSPNGPHAVSPTFIDLDSMGVVRARLIDATHADSVGCCLQDDYDIGSPRTPSAWPMDAPEWRDLGSIGSGPVDDNVWVEESGGWSIDDSCAGSPDDWGGSTTFAMSCSPDSIAPVCRTATLEHEEQLTELLYRCIRDLHSLQVSDQVHRGC